MIENIKKPSNKRTRAFSIITYVGEKNIQKVLMAHSRSVRAFAYILHDQDESTPHHHLLIKTYDAWTATQINKWFEGLKYEINENTLTEPATDLHALRDYLTHSDYKSRSEGKHLYQKTDIVDGGLFDMIDKKDSYDETYEILNQVIIGTGTRELVRKYGKNYLFHIQQFDLAAERVLHEDRRPLETIVACVKDELYDRNPLDEILANYDTQE